MSKTLMHIYDGIGTLLRCIGLERAGWWFHGRALRREMMRLAEIGRSLKGGQ